MERDLQALAHLFADHTCVLQELGESLRRQRESVVHWDLQALAQEQKVHNQIIVRLRVFDQARNASLAKLHAKLGLTGRPSMQTLLAALNDVVVGNIKQIYENFLAVAGSVRELYEENQRYLAHSLEGIEVSLTLLQSSRQNGGVYTPNGSGETVRMATEEQQKRYLDQNV